jgi:hypothetical protein
MEVGNDLGFLVLARKEVFSLLRLRLIEKWSESCLKWSKNCLKWYKFWILAVKSYKPDFKWYKTRINLSKPKENSKNHQNLSKLRSKTVPAIQIPRLQLFRRHSPCQQASTHILISFQEQRNVNWQTTETQKGI